MNQSQIQGFVGFDRLKISCIIGDFPDEREKEQEIFVTLRVKNDFSKVVHSDALVDAIDYTLLSQLCVDIASAGYRLIESYAFAVANKILTEFNVASVWIQVTKPSAVAEAEGAVVELTLQRDQL